MNAYCCWWKRGGWGGGLLRADGGRRARAGARGGAGARWERGGWWEGIPVSLRSTWRRDAHTGEGLLGLIGEGARGPAAEQRRAALRLLLVHDARTRANVCQWAHIQGRQTSCLSCAGIMFELCWSLLLVGGPTCWQSKR
jgi:hypothetical protein